MGRVQTQVPRKLDWPVILWMAGVHLLALLGFFYVTWQAVLVGFLLYFATGCLGITFGYHRLLTHRSFKAPVWLERLSATIGALAMQMGPVTWVGHHRMHHAFSDTGGDPHDASRGFWFSHWGWLFFEDPEKNDPVLLRKFARDIWADPYLRFIENRGVQLAMQFVLMGILYAFLGIPGVVWGIFVRLAVVYHVTWFVNSASHMFGYRTYESEDLARNCWWVGLLAFGEGWHNNHHSHPTVAPAGHLWWEFDITYVIIRTLQRLGIVQNVNLPPIWQQKRQEAGSIAQTLSLANGRLEPAVAKAHRSVSNA